MSDEEYPVVLEEDEEDQFVESLDEPIPVPEKQQKIMLPNGNTIKVAIKKPDTPAPVFHDTPLENQIDDDLSAVNINIENLRNMWSAVRTVEQAINLANAYSKQLAERRKLANKQLGVKEDKSGKGDIYYVPD